MLFRSGLKELRDHFSKGSGVHDILETAAGALLHEFGASRIALSYGKEKIIAEKRGLRHVLKDGVSPRLFSVVDGQVLMGSAKMALPLFISDLSQSSIEAALRTALEERSILSFASVPLYREGVVYGHLECHHVESYYRWRNEACYEMYLVSEHLSLFLEEISQLEREQNAPPKIQEEGVERASLNRLLETSDIFVVHTDSAFTPKTILGKVERSLGIPTAQLLESPALWKDLFVTTDAAILQSKRERLVVTRLPFMEELEVVNLATKEPRTLHIKGVPIEFEKGTLGWELIVSDVTESSTLKIELLAERRRREALQEISRYLVSDLEAAHAGFKALSSLLRATLSDSGFICLQSSVTGRLEVVAWESLSDAYVKTLMKVINRASLVKLAVDQSQGMVINNLPADIRSSNDILRIGGMKSAVLVPVRYRGMAMGAVVLLSHHFNRFSQTDFDLVEGAANQLAVLFVVEGSAPGYS